MIWILRLKLNGFKDFFAYRSRFGDTDSLANGFSKFSYALG